MGGRGEGREMLYSNVNKTVETRHMSFGELRGIALGEPGRGRKEIFLPVPEKFPPNIPARSEVITEFSIGLSKAGRPRVVADDGNLYLILDCKGVYTRGTLGVVYGLVDHEYNVIESAYGAYGEAGNVGTWYATIVKAKDGDVFRVKKSGGADKVGPSIVYLVSKNKVYHCEQQLAEEMFEALGRELPFTLNGNKVLMEEWKNLK